jgi:hypothetical protein
MNISKQEAQESLTEIENIISQTRRAIAHGGTGTMLIIWGIIWALGYSASQFINKWAGTIWLLLILFGAVASWICGVRNKPLTKNSNYGRVGLFWLILFGYAIVWVVLLRPVSSEAVGAFWATIPMFAYVVGGLWFGRFFVWLGLIVTALAVAGFFLLPAWFDLWMAVTGGGALILSGLFIRKFWR